MASTIKIEIVDGEAVVTADGTPQSCAVAHDIEKAIGTVKKTVKTGTKPVTTHVQAKS